VHDTRLLPVDWQPKTWEARDIEGPDELLKILKEPPRRGKLVFSNSNGNKYTHSWDDCVEIAGRRENTRTAGTARVRGSRIRRQDLWVGLWVDKLPPVNPESIIDEVTVRVPLKSF
jgi:hypothetical protein